MRQRRLLRTRDLSLLGVVLLVFVVGALVAWQPTNAATSTISAAPLVHSTTTTSQNHASSDADGEQGPPTPAGRSVGSPSWSGRAAVRRLVAAGRLDEARALFRRLDAQYPDDSWVTALRLDLELQPTLSETEHFLLLSSAEPNETAPVLARLELFYSFFLGAGAPILADSEPASEKHVVYLLRDRKQLEFMRQRLGHVMITHNRGFYSPRVRAVVMYASPSTIRTLQHELTHQLLAELVGDGRPAPWLVEGVAMLFERAHLFGGELVMPASLSLSRTMRCTEYQQRHELLSIERVASLRYDAFHAGRYERRNYDQAEGLFLYLLCRNGAPGGRALLTFVGESYRSKRRLPLSALTRINTAELERSYRAYLRTATATLPDQWLAAAFGLWRANASRSGGLRMPVTTGK